MNSITKAVEVVYGVGDEPQPQFTCPVVVDSKVLTVLQGTRNRVETIVGAAASAVELVGRFEAGSRYVDFAPTLALSIGDLPIALRVRLVTGRIGNIARIDLANADRRH